VAIYTKMNAKSLILLGFDYDPKCLLLDYQFKCINPDNS
jgi:hypothetical protein